MERLRADDPTAVARAAQILASGGVVLYPTDTLYGLGADAFSDEAVAKIYEIKGREQKKPIHAIVDSIGTVGRFALVNDAGNVLAEKFWPGALTLIFSKRENIEGGIARDIPTIGFRIPDNQFCLDVATLFGKPFTATSANKSTQQPQRSIENILLQVGLEARLIDLIIDAGELPERSPSSVVDVASGRAVLLREGAISAPELGITS